MKIPERNRWTQINSGETLGALNETYNQVLDTPGEIKLAKRPVAIVSSQTDNDFGDLVALQYFDNQYVAVTDDRLFTGDLLGTEWSQESQFTPNTTIDSDALVFNDRLVVTTNSNIDDWDGNLDDRTNLKLLNSSVPHPMAIFDSQTTFKLAVGNGNEVIILNSSYVESTTSLILPSQFIVTSLAYRNGYLYVATKTTDGTEARVFIWNGSGTNAQYEAPVGSEWIYSIIPYGQSVACITSNGQLLQIAGTTAVLLAALPVYYKPHTLWQGATNGIAKVYPRGMVAKGDLIYINLEGSVDTGFIPEMKSGLWVFDPEAGLYHRATASTDTLVSDNNLSLSDDIVTTSAVHNLKTGDGVQFKSVSGISGIDIDNTYYVTVVSPTEIKLSITREALNAEKYTQLSGTPTTSDVMFYFPNTDNGSQDTRAGAIALSTINETAKESISTEVFWGTRTKDQSGNNTYTLSVFHDSNTIGSFATQREYSDSIQDTWKDIYTFIDGIQTIADSLVIKKQTKPINKTILLDGVWSNTNTINATGKATAWYEMEIGDEVFLYDGQGQGKTAHIVSKTEGKTPTITLDEEYGVLNATISFYRTRFHKIDVKDWNNKDDEYTKSTIQQANKSTWIKIKVEQRGSNMSINRLELPAVTHKGT